MNHATEHLIDPEEIPFIAGKQPESKFTCIFDLWEAFTKANPLPGETAPQFVKNNYAYSIFHAFYTAGRLQGIREERLKKRLAENTDKAKQGDTLYIY